MELKESDCYGAAPATRRGYASSFGVLTGKDGKSTIGYGNQSLVVMKGLEEPKNCTYFEGHAHQVKVCEFSPNGWVASGDDSGTVIVWSAATLVPKQEFKMGKSINDIRWGDNGKRLAIGGVGEKENFRTASWNTSESTSKINGYAGNVLSCDMRPTRPYHVVIASEDPAVTISNKAPPYTYMNQTKHHKSYPNCIRYHPAGDEYVSVGADARIFVYDGKTGEMKREIADGKYKKGKNHKGSIYVLSFNKDGSQFATCSADKTVKIWDYEKGTCLSTFKPHKDKLGVDDMQLCCAFVGEEVVSLSLNGQLNFFKSGKKFPVKVQAGHQNSINSVCVKDGTIYSADANGRICVTNIETGACSFMKGAALTNIKFLGMSGNNVVTFENNGTLRFHDTEKMEVNTEGFLKDDKVAPYGLSYSKKSALVAVIHSKKKLHVFKDGKQAHERALDYYPNGVAVSGDDKTIAVAGDNGKLYFYAADDEKSDPKEFEHKLGEKVSRLKYSDCGKYLMVNCSKLVAAYDATKEFKTGETEPLNPALCKGYQSHIVDCDMAGLTLVTVASDRSIYMWPAQGKGLKGMQSSTKFSHKLGLTCVRAINGGKQILTASHDASMKIWDLTATGRKSFIRAATTWN